MSENYSQIFLKYTMSILKRSEQFGIFVLFSLLSIYISLLVKKDPSKNEKASTV